MRERDIGMIVRVGESCRTCRFHQLRTRDYGYCSHHAIELLAHFGDNPYGYDDKGCAAFEHADSSQARAQPVILVTARLYDDGETDYQLGEGYLLRAMEGGQLEIRSGGDDGQRIAGIEDYMLMFVELDPQDMTVVLTYTNRKVHVPLPS